MKWINILTLFFTGLFLWSTTTGCSEDAPPLTQDISEIEVEDSTSEVADDTNDESTEVEGCDCLPTEICVSNDQVTNECFPRDCLNISCDQGEICFNDECVDENCGGIVCSDENMRCRGGLCIFEDCNDPEVGCPQGYECVEDNCLKRCQDQSYCEEQACIDGYCVSCTDDNQCETGTICIQDGCVLPCTENPDLCDSGEACNEQTGHCGEGCSNDEYCGEHEICDFNSAQCVEEECTTPGETDECGDGELCLQRRCESSSPLFFGGFISGGGDVSSELYLGQVCFAPVAMIGPASESSSYLLLTGPIYVLDD